MLKLYYFRTEYYKRLKKAIEPHFVNVNPSVKNSGSAPGLSTAFVPFEFQGLDISRQSESSVKSGKSGHVKKMERKVAGSSASKGDKEKGGNKPTAWK